MYDEDAMHPLGRLGSPWGHLGHLKIHFDSLEPSDLEPQGTLFLDIQGQRVPFRYTEVRERARGVVLVKFEDVEDPEAASVFTGCAVLAPPGMLADMSDDTWGPDDLVGMLVHDQEHGELGEVLRMEGNAK
ncbi:MAG: hypothetical protein KDB88_13335, partial [Flavobacteriales bacterium]|nr:hypothetical protein [Flavobacteriales bacterium]